jgi:hypothetical protein
MQNRFKMSMTAGAIVSLIALLISVTPVAAQEGGNNTGGTDTGSTTQQATTDDSSNGSANQQSGGTNQQQQSGGTGAATDPCANQTQGAGQNTNTAVNQGNNQANTTDASPDQSGNDDGQSGDDTGNSADMTSGTDTSSGNTNQGQTQDASTGAAQTPCPGTNRETAGPNFAESVQLAPGTTHWYRFRYVYDEDIDDEPSQAVVSLKMNPVGCASFDVTTSGRLNFPFNEEGDPIGPVGRGTPAPILDGTTPGTLLWVGSGEFSETHFVIVRNRSNEPCTYTLSITGSPVVF